MRVSSSRCVVLTGDRRQALAGDVRLYAHWAHRMQRGVDPTVEREWQYPPGAAWVMRLVSATPVNYLLAFLLLMLVCDGLVLLLLVRGAAMEETRSAWLWIVGIAALGPVTWFRFDLVPTALAVAALTTASPRARGVLIGLGTWVKLWPVALLAASPRRSLPRITAATAVVIALTGMLTTLVRGSLPSLFGHQGGRGIQFESIPADAVAGRSGPGLTGAPNTPVREPGGRRWFAARHLAAAGTGHRGPCLRSHLLTNRVSELQAAPGALAAVLVLVVTSRVISPQYLVWLLGVGAAVLPWVERPRRTLWLLVLAALLSQLIFPWFYPQLPAGSRVMAATVLIRNGLLVCLLVILVGQLRRQRTV